MSKTKDQEKAELKARLMGQISGFQDQRRRALHAAALVHGFAIVAFAFLFYFAADARARLEAIERRHGGSVAPVASRSS